ncbi:unnamed protein product [Rangifer tarandus platyrhynchus]|uniref:Uncharacterized protein n=2 Tax=Rangifer tarandus platyrhynchus TaxID=3082113 RepID=A0ABN8YWZ8_RANTA|nr:unnamed protein product [Rangifer tarandus platyrhynchus]CAI9702059.1 unnamed protein product [Rangifer tarandus platyrhynchus]
MSPNREPRGDRDRDRGGAGSADQPCPSVCGRAEEEPTLSPSCFPFSRSASPPKKGGRKQGGSQGGSLSPGRPRACPRGVLPRPRVTHHSSCHIELQMLLP